MPNNATPILFVHHPNSTPPTQTTNNPGWADVEAEIRALDGQDCDQVILYFNDDHSLLIGGGENGIYICEVEEPGGQFILADRSTSTSETLTVMNGQPGDYVLSHTVALADVIRAAKAFYFYGKADASLYWDAI